MTVKLFYRETIEVARMSDASMWRQFVETACAMPCKVQEAGVTGDVQCVKVAPPRLALTVSITPTGPKTLPMLVRRRYPIAASDLTRSFWAEDHNKEPHGARRP